MSFFGGKIEQIRSRLDSDRPVPTDTVVFSGTLFAEFQPITDERVKAVLWEMPKKSCDLEPIPVPILHDCLEEITPIVVISLISLCHLVSSFHASNMLLSDLC